MDPANERWILGFCGWSAVPRTKFVSLSMSSSRVGLSIIPGVGLMVLEVGLECVRVVARHRGGIWGSRPWQAVEGSGSEALGQGSVQAQGREHGGGREAEEVCTPHSSALS